MWWEWHLMSGTGKSSGCHTASRVDSVCWVCVFFWAHCSGPSFLVQRMAFLHETGLQGNNCLLAIAPLSTFSSHLCQATASLGILLSLIQVPDIGQLTHSPRAVPGPMHMKQSLYSKAYIHSLPALEFMRPHDARIWSKGQELQITVKGSDQQSGTSFSSLSSILELLSAIRQRVLAAYSPLSCPEPSG